MRSRRSRPLFVIDIAVPRDVEPAVGNLDQVFLYHMDDLQTIVKENLARRSSELTSAESIVDEEVARFASWLQSREVVPTIVALRQRFEQIRQGELRRLEPKLTGLTPEARAKVDEVTRLLIEKLLLTPTEQLKSVGDETVAAYAEALHRLFALNPVGDDEKSRARRAARSPEPAAVEERARASGLRRVAAAWHCGRPHAVSDRLQRAGAATEIIVLTTTGDRSQHGPVAGDDSKRQFVKELEDALLRGDADIAVHSAKDLPVVLPEGLGVAACLQREDPRDAIVLPQSEAGGHEYVDVAGARTRLGGSVNVGTGSVRRIAQLAPLFPQAAFPPIRGNVDTRLARLDGGKVRRPRSRVRRIASPRPGRPYLDAAAARFVCSSPRSGYCCR